MKFIPVRGRKPILRAIRAFIIDVEIYPREGTETCAWACETQFHSLKFIPVRGRKPVSDEISSSVIVEIYPREGTETFPLVQNDIYQIVEIYPREGIETCDVKTIESSFFSNLNDKFNPKGLYKKGKMC